TERGLQPQASLLSGGPAPNPKPPQTRPASHTPPPHLGFCLPALPWPPSRRIVKGLTPPCTPPCTPRSSTMVPGTASPAPAINCAWTSSTACSSTAACSRAKKPLPKVALAPAG